MKWRARLRVTVTPAAINANHDRRAAPGRASLAVSAAWGLGSLSLAQATAQPGAERWRPSDTGETLFAATAVILSLAEPGPGPDAPSSALT